MEDDTDITKEERLKILTDSLKAVKSKVFVFKSQALAFKEAELLEEAKAAANEQAKWMRVAESYSTMIANLQNNPK